MTAGETAIHVRALTRRYGTLEAVRGIDLDVQTGEIFGLIGPDGAGKTSTFQILGGVMEATSGIVELLGQPARRARAYVGYLTQAFSLYPDLSVAENLRYVGDLRRVSRPDIEARGRRYLSMFGMERFAGRLAGRLSGGMKQKLALACALVTEPRILLLDEPTTGVDPVSRREFWDALAHLSSEGITILLGQGYNQDSAACAIDEAARQDVDVLDVLTRDQVTARELSVLAAVQEYCVDRLGGSTIPTPSGTPDSAPTSVSD